ncbi:hypothetical protein [Sporosarcina gallistercoris]|uniref:Uncharacterized protein n=1 Tax=Sporosarcina gallistercoris TaxID=2762245 RepID=A0ABR8PNA2_9BACL|nr:hypothetical protein [Sporosarcina gallistercoris]MBD7909663.1 hypothetical protein [Sporosarcina gallistercoris]
MVLGTVLLSLASLYVLYIVIFSAVKDGIDKSEVGQLLKAQYGIQEKKISISDDEIEKILEDEFKN